MTKFFTLFYRSLTPQSSNKFGLISDSGDKDAVRIKFAHIKFNI